MCLLGSTHGTNPYKFQLSTILVLDNVYQGSPGTHMFSSRADEEVFKVLLSEVRDKLGIIKTKVFMSDMAGEIYNAWVQIMGEADYRLYCAWHVVKAWRRNVSKIKTEKKRDDTYKSLEAVMQELDEKAFAGEFAELLHKLCLW